MKALTQSTSTPGYGLAVTALIIGIVSLPLVGLCGLGIPTAILGFVMAVRARRVAGQGAEGARGLATAGIVVNGVLLALAGVGFAIFGLALFGTLWTRTLPTQRPSIAASRKPAHEMPTLPSPRIAGGTVPPETLPDLPRTVALGESVKVGALRVAVLAYVETDKCPEGGGRPAQGAKFVIAQASARNDGAEVIDLPRIHWMLDSYDAGLGAGHSCRYNQRAFGNACWVSEGRLFPGAACEGWLLFEIPEGVATESTKVRAQISSARSGVAGTVTWQAR